LVGIPIGYPARETDLFIPSVGRVSGMTDDDGNGNLRLREPGIEKVETDVLRGD